MRHHDHDVPYIVIVKNTVGGTLSGTDGLGDWNIPWNVWKAGNADV